MFWVSRSLFSLVLSLSWLVAAADSASFLSSLLWILLRSMSALAGQRRSDQENRPDLLHESLENYIINQRCLVLIINIILPQPLNNFFNNECTTTTMNI